MTRSTRKTSLFGPAAAVLAVAAWLAAGSAAGQSGADAIPRTADGTPDLNGVWQALGTAHWDLLDNAAEAPPFYQLGAIGAVPGGRGVVEGNVIPYQPWAAEQQKENHANRPSADPEAKCYLPGVPRATYLPFPFQIVQTTGDILITYEFANADRLINMGEPKPFPYPMWMGWSNGRWDGDTLVVEVTGLNGLTWLDRSGNFVSDNARVEERYTPMTPYHLLYEATIDDPTVFTRPWKISMPLYRRMEPHAQLVEFRCVEFAEELLYGEYVR